MAHSQCTPQNCPQLTEDIKSLACQFDVATGTAGRHKVEGNGHWQDRQTISLPCNRTLQLVDAHMYKDKTKLSIIYTLLLSNMLTQHPISDGRFHTALATSACPHVSSTLQEASALQSGEHELSSSSGQNLKIFKWRVCSRLLLSRLVAEGPA